MASNELTVQSEIYSEIESALQEQPILIKSNVASSFRFKLPATFFNGTCNGVLNSNHEEPNKQMEPKTLEGVIKLEHSASTPIKLVGLQIWRGALLLADYVLHFGDKYFKNRTILEIGAGVGLTSIVASMFAKEVIATDLDVGGILDLLNSNFKLNHQYTKSPISVMPLDFFNLVWSEELNLKMKETDIVLAADVIYDNDLTNGFVDTLTKILSTPPRKTIYICLEKRYVFNSAPCYDYFLDLIHRSWVQYPMSTWHFEQVAVDFPQYFYYDRVKDFVLWKVSAT